MANTILVTTPGGKVGSEVAKLLLAQKLSVRIAAHTVDKAKKQFPGAEVVPFDFADERSATRALEGISAVYLASPGDAPAGPENKLIDAAKKLGVKKIVKLSVIHAEKVTKAHSLEVEQHLAASGLDYTILRPNWFFQNYTTSMVHAVQSGALAEPAGDKKTSFIDARDIAAVAVEALTRDGYNGKTLTLTGPQALTRAEVAAALSKAIGKPVKYVDVSDAQLREAVKPFLSPAYLELMSQLYSLQRGGIYEPITDTVQEVLGHPARTFEAFAKEHAQAWK